LRLVDPGNVAAVRRAIGHAVVFFDGDWQPVEGAVLGCRERVEVGGAGKGGEGKELGYAVCLFVLISPYPISKLQRKI
jgi:hypothetical protein